MCLFKAALYIYHSKNDKKNANFWLILILSPVHFIYTNYGVQIWLISYLHSNCASRKNLVNFMWNSHEIFTWNSCEKSTTRFLRELFIRIALERDFKLILCEIHVNFHINITWSYLTWKLHEISSELHFTRIKRGVRAKLHVKTPWIFTWISRVAQLAVHVL